MSRKSTFRGPRTSIANDGRPQSKGEEEKGMWSSMLDSVAKGKKLLEKDLVVLGGTPSSQRDFLDTLASDAPKRPQDRHKKKPSVANDFALGYTYQDVLDADHEDILARLSIYFLSEPSSSFVRLLKPLFTPRSIPQTLLVILLDWSEPWSWVRQLREWLVFIRSITSSLDEENKQALEDNMKEWQRRRQGGQSYDAGGAPAGIENDVTLPLSSGEWDEPLGLPLCVVCQNADKINTLEIEQSWREEDFDFILQFLRTVLMKHGASLIYTSSSNPNSLPTLIHSTLGIYSQLKKQALKHDVIDRDKILVPPNWDSWGKIRVLREGFDVEGVSSGWSLVLESSEEQAVQPDKNDKDVATSDANGAPIMGLYEQTIKNPSGERNQANPKPRIEVSAPSHQAFLASQLEVMDRLKAEEEKAAGTSTPTRAALSQHSISNAPATNERLNDQIGPVQVNMGGIQVDADDMLQKLKNRDNTPKSPEIEGGNASGADLSTPDMKAQNEALNSFFAGLMKRGASNSPRNVSTPSKDPRKAT